eukprot:TRINITY_DN19043_c0_g1_i1.p2 TRINITY_DN19043_c0_g1~~TRINITY_DN19043_c0_g1_i1.p2  ORF type:complete len:179 (+),score=51.46 TRINITY_DN19043_c0_g1_i1:46-537(+)
MRQRVVALLQQGVDPRTLALSLALGCTLGVFPIVGTTSVLCAAAAVALRLNLPAMQLLNYVVWPIQTVLVLGFARLGEWLGQVPPEQALSPSQLAAAVASGELAQLAWLLSYAVLGWVVCVGPLTLALFQLFGVLTAALHTQLGHGRGDADLQEQAEKTPVRT